MLKHFVSSLETHCFYYRNSIYSSWFPEKNNTDKLNLSGQIVRSVITYLFLAIYKRTDK